MRTTLITLILATASAVAAAQTTQGAREPADGRSWFDNLADFWGYAPIEEVREREAAVEEREAAVEKHAARLSTRETAVGRREAAVSQREEDVISGLQRLEQRDAAVSRLEEDATRKRDEGVRIAWAGVILGAGIGAWSLWRLQPSRVGRLNQRRRNAERSLASMQASETRLKTQLRKTAAALTKAKRKHASIEEARDEAETNRREAESMITKLSIDLEDAKRRNAWLRKARDEAEAKRREAESTITRLRVDLEDAKRRAREADGSRSTRERTARHILGVAVGASRDDVEAAYKRVAFTVHPDRCTGPEAERLMRLVNDAVDQLRAA